jgi:hypothetical protein
MRTGAASQVNRLYAKLSGSRPFRNASNHLASACKTSVLQAYFHRRDRKSTDSAESGWTKDVLVKILF